MNNEFLEPVPEALCTYWGYEKIATTRTPLDVAILYAAILKMRRSEICMAKSMHHAAVMMGEYDDPPDEPPQDEPNKALGWAAFFGIASAAYYVRYVLDHHSYTKPPDEEMKRRMKMINRNGGTAYACMEQLLFAAMDDDRGLAEMAKYYRTNYLGDPNSEDIKMAEPLKNWIMEMTRNLDMAREAWEHGEFNQVLMRWVYRYPAGSGWSAPIFHPKIDIVDDEENS